MNRRSLCTKDVATTCSQLPVSPKSRGRIQKTYKSRGKGRQYARNEQNYWIYVTGFVLQYNNHGSGAFHVIVASCISKGLSEKKKEKHKRCLTSGCFPIPNTLSQVVFPWRQQLDKAGNFNTQCSPKRDLKNHSKTQEAWKPTIFS